MAGNSSFDIIGTAFAVAKMYNGSNTLKKFDAVVESETLKTLSGYVNSSKAFGLGINSDLKDTPELENFNVVKITPTRNLGEVENNQEMYLITDSSGHDIGIYYPADKNGVPKFILSDRIRNQNRKIIESFKGDEEKNILRQRYLVPGDSENFTLKDLVERLANGRGVALASVEQGRAEIKEQYEGMEFLGDNENLQKQEQDEVDVLSNIPSDMRAEAMQFARENNLRVKEILIVDNPDIVAGMIDNRQNQISRSRGPVILIRTSSSGTDLTDDVYAFQDGRAIQREANDGVLLEYMEEHKNEGHVSGLEPLDKNREFLETQRIYDEAQVKIEEELKKIAELEAQINNLQNSNDFETDNDKEKAISHIENEIAQHKKNIDDIQNTTNNRIKEVLEAKNREGSPDKENSGQRSRWEEANPNNPS
ncbi:MAG: hypothetical protein IKM97_03130 [Clostridia bacterium]|nr:hypothetical protein [Clostridia bacterium]